MSFPFVFIIRFRFYFAYFVLLHPTVWIMFQHVPIICIITQFTMNNLQSFILWRLLCSFVYSFVRLFVDWFDWRCQWWFIRMMLLGQTVIHIRLLNAMVHSVREKKTHFLCKQMKLSVIWAHYTLTTCTNIQMQFWFSKLFQTMYVSPNTGTILALHFEA